MCQIEYLLLKRTDTDRRGGAARVKDRTEMKDLGEYHMGVKRWGVFVYEHLSVLSTNVVPLSKSTTLIV